MSDVAPLPTAGRTEQPELARPRSRSAWGLVAAELVAGTLAAGAGAGLAFRHLSKAGWTVTTVTGFVLLTVGLLLLGAGLLGFWRRAGRWYWRLLLFPATLAGLVVAASTAIAVVASFVPPTALGSQTPSDRGLTYQDVSFTTSDGAELSAWYVPSANGAAVVVLHGSGSTRTATLPQAAVLADHGYGVLLLDARGHGESGGRGMDLGWYGELDIAAAVDHLSSQPDVDPDRIGLLGESMGGEEAIGAAGVDPRVRAVVAEGATSRTAEDKAAWLPGGVAGNLQRGIDRMTYALVGLLTPAPHPAPLADAVARATTTPFLLVTAGNVPDEAAAAEALQRAAPDRVTVWTVPEAGHTGGLATAPEEWEQQVVGFLDWALGPAAD